MLKKRVYNRDAYINTHTEEQKVVYRTRDSITTHEQLLEVIVTFCEIFQFIFYNVTSNPTIEIEAYNPIENNINIFRISTKYQRNREVTLNIAKEYTKIIEQNEYMKDFENIIAVELKARGPKRGRQLIYYNENRKQQ